MSRINQGILICGIADQNTKYVFAVLIHDPYSKLHQIRNQERLVHKYHHCMVDLDTMS